MIIRAVVSLLWREKARRTLAEQFQAPLAAVLELLREGDGPEGQRRRGAAEMATVSGIAMILSVANDAMLEGRSAEIDGDQLVNALDTLRRLAFAIDNMARHKIATTGVAKNAAGNSVLIGAIRIRLESWLQSLRDQTESGVTSLAPLRKMVADAKVPDLPLWSREVHSASPETDVSYGAAAERVIRLTQTLELQLAAVSLN
jgi:hypothetical protein